jgi:hypothetical protein
MYTYKITKFICSFLLLLSLGFVMSIAQAQDKKPNIVVIDRL